MSLITQRPSDYVRCYGCGDVTYKPDHDKELTYCRMCGGTRARIGGYDALLILTGYYKKEAREGRPISTL